jgi:murein DD-endopeptidase MepM/ murein hydrolase activator NlpD
VPSGAIAVQLTQSEMLQTNLLNLVRDEHPGIFIFEGLLITLDAESLKQRITNLHFEQQRFFERQHIVLLDDEIELPLALHSILPVLEYPFPTKREIQQQIMWLCETQEVEATLGEQRQMVQACVGLPQGEIQLVMQRVLGQSRSAIEIAQRVLDYKQKKLRGRGINLLPKPDVESAVGLEGLDDTLDKIRLLLQPEAEQYNLRPPKAVLLWGIPGSAIDGSGSDANRALSIKDYGVRARQNYEAAAKGIQPQNCTKTAQANPTGNTGSGEAGKASGTLTDPAPGATSQHNYGEDRGDHIHQGVDLSGEMGDPILAADGGTVILEKNDPGGYGNFIVVDHGNGRLTLYGHLDQFRVRQGESVKKGQRIGDMGSTGRSTGPHLHFEVIEGATSGNAYSGTAVNPEPYLKP